MSGTGFYGKLASRGDFVSRGLPTSFITGWDTWLAAGIAHSQAAMGEGWLQAYLVSPLWRFAVAAGVCGEQAVAGVVMPSVDRVGRYFPLTVACVLPAGADLASLPGGHEAWFGQAEALMLQSLEEGAGFEAFEAGVQALPPLVPGQAPTGEQQGPWVRLASLDNGATRLWLQHWACQGASLWWGEGSEQVAAGVRRCDGLPPAPAFAGLLGAQGA